ncbi:MAG TPA: branched-chain amino acid ABC transporter permease, partial [Steroidobacteraceae bacterium]|nr:branched-chain amino acid ABC transporter permease [Steroidobacteraceae bacterium]
MATRTAPIVPSGQHVGPTRTRSPLRLGLAAGRGATRGLLRASLLLGLLLPLRLGTYQLTVLTVALVYVVALSSLVVLTGYVGQVSLAQASFMGLGAFLCAALMGHFGMSYWLAAPLTVAVVFVAGVAAGLPALRLRGLTLAIVTLSLALLADNFLFQGVGWLTNNGNHWRVARPTLFGASLDKPGVLFDFVLVAMALTLYAIVRLRQGRTGKSWYAMRDAEIAASTSGVPVVTMKLLGFGIAAALAAVAGVLYALAVGSVSPEPFTFVYSIQLLAIAVIAGIRSLPGAVVGALFFIILPQFLLQFPALVPLTSLILGT